MSDTDRIDLMLPRALLERYAAWAKQQIDAGDMGPNSTHGAASALCLRGLSEQPGREMVKVSPRGDSLSMWFSACEHHDAHHIRVFAKALETAWRAAAAKAEPKPKPPDPIPAEVIAYVRSLTAAEVEDVPKPAPPAPPKKPERTLF